MKSCRGISVERAELDSLGLVGDRRLMIIQPRPLPLSGSFEPNEATHGFLTQRQCPALATIEASLPTTTTTTSNNSISIELSNSSYSSKSITVDISEESLLSLKRKRYKASIWGDVVDVVDMGDEASNFIQSIIQQHSHSSSIVVGVRLVSMIPSVTERIADAKFVPKSVSTNNNTEVSLADGFPLLLTSEFSLNELNRRLTMKGKSTLPMSRFRPNIVVSSSSSQKQQQPQPFDEDEWKVLSITSSSSNNSNNNNPLILHVVKGCPRCKQSCVDQITGNNTDTEPLETMADFRKKDSSGDVFFGQNVLLAETTSNDKNIIQVGDTVHIIQRGSPVWG